MRHYRSQIGVRRVLGFILLAIVGIFVFGSVVMMLWNALLPVLFHFPVISFWQALGLLLLAKILFGNFRGGGGPGRRWKQRMEQNLANMTPEEKEKIRQEWGRRCGRGFERGTSSPDTSPNESKQD
jgi:hypothetical protein